MLPDYLTQDPIKASAWKLPLSHTDQRTFFHGRVISVREPWAFLFFGAATNHGCGADSRKAANVCFTL